MTEIWLPPADPSYRVPRSDVDALYITGRPAEPKRAGVGIVVSIDGATITVLIDEEEISGVVFLGDEPEVGDAVEIEVRGELLVALPDDYRYEDTYTEGSSTTAPHIVDDESPGAPTQAEVNVAGSMKDPDYWLFSAASAGWNDALYESGVGLRVFQRAAVLQARNQCLTPSFETGLGTWHSNSMFGSGSIATLTQDSVRYLFGSHSMKIEWHNPVAAERLSNALIALSLDKTKQYVLSLHVFIPEGSPTIQTELAFYQRGPKVEEREQWVWTEMTFAQPANQTHAYVGIATDDPSEGTMCWVDAVVVREVGTPMPPNLTYFDGSLPPTGTAYFAWDGAAHASTSAWYDGPPGSAGSGDLFSIEEFDVRPGDVLDVAATLSKIAPEIPTAQVVICYGPTVGLQPDPRVDPIMSYGTAVSVDEDNEPLAASVIVPQTAGPSSIIPATAMIGIRFTGTGTADLVVHGLSLKRTAGAFPIGSLWLNPSAGNALPTIGTTAHVVTATGLSWAGQGSTATGWGRMPSGHKALVTAPPDCDGIVLAFYQCTLRMQSGSTTAVGIHVAVQFYGAVQSGSPFARYATTVASTSDQRPVNVQGWATVEAGQTVEVVPSYQYGADPGSTGILALMDVQLTVLFIPTGVAAGAAGKPAAMSFWDGDSWRDGVLDPAKMDLTQLASVTPPAKTNTTTSITRNDSDVHAGTTVTLTATVSPAATGSVTFYSATSSGGPWTSQGSVALSGGKASKTAVSSLSRTYYYKAVYSGSTTHNGSSSAVTSVRWRTRQTTTKTYRALWVQAYAADGDKISGGNYPNGAQQGDVGGGSTNRRSMIGFPAPSFSGSELRVTSVQLHCKDWQWWRAGDHKGTLIVGWHEALIDTEPNTYRFDQVHNDRSRHPKGLGNWWVNLTGWADAIVLRSDFGGITIGPGASDAVEYGGWSNNGPSQWELEITCEFWD